MKFTKKVSVVFISALLLLPITASAYTDVREKDWYYKPVVEATQNGYIQGYQNNTFKPHRNITRSQIAKMFGRVIGMSDRMVYDVPFRDVSKSHSAHDEITLLTQNGVFVEADYFNPSKPMTRAQYSKVLVKTLSLPYKEGLENPFSDSTDAHWWNGYVSYLYHAGIIKGKTPSTFDPNAPVTRAQAASMLMKAIEFRKNPQLKNIVFDPYTDAYRSIVFSHEQMMRDTVTLVNRERTKQGLPTVTGDFTLHQLATIKSIDLSERKYWDHKSPTYGHPWDMASGFGYRYVAFGENIAHGYKSAEDVVAAWMNSEGHRKNILNKTYTHIGVGIVQNELNEFYYVHMFSKK